ncbi:Frag1/DRAM/Sfk1 [Metarhizium album ARSEF 1941]|uniref:Frag1/DRAM/Sfk1 n=1 Tax=Metarhizium album (strain ARSEF 1941) TaxID=1081103 RepID=A0A0B2WPJ0_METAS|nr:Frag1/DRAM/Sfk1 [Metarhizium album ARSEF 1941]KHN95392.1 Frag1/DRAM/Sfk1 [Metarhizium album ARSEF 1941]
MAARGFFSYWLLPVVSSLVWLGMLLGMLLHWIVDTHRRIYPTMDRGGTIAYISDIGAQQLKPLFIAGSAVTVVLLDLAFFAERWLRHRGRLVRNQSSGERALVWLSILFAIVGAAGLILLSIFDTWRHPRAHDVFLLLFIGGYWLSAVFICWEYQRLGIKNRQHRILRSSFWIKLAFIMVELVLAIVFVSTTFTHNNNVAAVFEWAVAFIFTFYVASFIIDLKPAIHTKSHAARFEKTHHLEDALPANGHSAVNGDGFVAGRNGRHL